MKNKIRKFLYWKLTFLRDKKWMPWFLVKFIDWIRYDLLFDIDSYY